MIEKRYYRKVIRIRAEDSPNVRLAMAQITAGLEPTGEVVVSGLLTYDEYKKRRLLWDRMEQTVSLDAEFYRGGEAFLFPKDVLQEAKRRARGLSSRRQPLAMGIDAAEGRDFTVWTVVDRLGVIYQLSEKTADTADVPGITLGLIKKYRLDPAFVLFDRGGGGKQHADNLRRRGYSVRTVGFGEKASDPHKDYKTATTRLPVSSRVDTTELHYAYKNRRAEMYGMTADAVITGFAIPAEYGELINQLGAIPKQLDGEGRLYLPPKDKPYPGYTGVTITGILGRSPDEADSLVLAVYGMRRVSHRVTAGAI